MTVVVQEASCVCAGGARVLACFDTSQCVEDR